MTRVLTKFFIAFSAVFILDQLVKQILLSGFTWQGEYFSLVLAFNKGVAFSMLEFLGEWLKFIQLLLISAVLIYLIWQNEILKDHTLPIGILLGAGSSNLLDRFVHGGVVDYVYWHKWFSFAIFNLADVMIDIAVCIILWQSFLAKSKKEKSAQIS
ncbi:signal peptidase II [Campylobacter sp. RM16192]|uniref:signal peptidase II n=1 Tax=Campylobacter sp. RM16192 TaxID=1660080 RepID=UPI001451BB48|nr:signal peptidase II [Campylobacter sp. RM16192]QCD53409.1 prolipoprotein signal peptidase II [Campylobacter sp. RM16192]